MIDEAKDPRIEAILERRALNLSTQEADTTTRRVDSTVALVSVGSETMGLPVASLREIVKTPAVTLLPQLPSWMPGIIQIRGEILAVVDLSGLLGNVVKGAGTFVAVLESQNGPIGLLVDGVIGFCEIYADELADAADARLAERHSAVRAVTRDYVSILDTERLLAHERLSGNRDSMVTSEDEHGRR